ncbi:MAG: HAMP domain-containing sensor histidine kinase, partial [Proteobacteria bacterium]|nr:HAMP domain-containing sensor histidine kinase [Pseudomonadota bacterium]
EVQLALQGETVSRLRYKNEYVAGAPLDSISRTSRVRVFVSSPIRVDGVLVGAVMLSRTPPGIVQALYAKRWLLLQAMGLLLGLVVVMSLLTYRLIARPISRLAEHASAIASGQEHAVRTQPAQRARTLEVARLQESLENMAVTLEERANYLVDFARHVSHEFKTPLAGISGSVELLKDHGEDMDADTRERFLGNIADDADRLHRLTQRLLELTRAELDVATRVTFRLEEVAGKLIEGNQSLDVHVSPASAQSLISGNPDALLAVLEILEENAAQHGATRLSIDAQKVDESVLISVSDDGEGISAGNRERVFEPFFTTTRNLGGTGLGLSIAVALLKPTKGVLSLAASGDQAGACFVIRVDSG